MGSMIKALLRSLLLRCPRCGSGRMFESMFRMRRQCPSCGLPFQQEAGDITGGMGINIVATLIIFVVGFIALLIAGVDPLVQMAIWLPFMVIFPILFYPASRALWTAILFVSGQLEPR